MKDSVHPIIVIMLSRLHAAKPDPLRLADFPLEYEQMESEASQLRMWRRIAKK